ncbi:hypothetical protein AD006_25140 [Pseudonocardia sp. EC080610-09]|uniref:citrate:proton symporter n=1 Tax=unclassified Pseudonocardia TaxID=2619320 RepID=UPI000705EC82|nr:MULTISPECIES: citrate:proton symporter [unclassified Pseudonocardia]ALL77770.1 hypothetical protein AD006_25140 [Pseudonocardia sp. EC080610-09]ALL80685.1 hypothetical protein AD017_04730 [Pseudonocardia sp. EC080619-01]
MLTWLTLAMLAAFLGLVLSGRVSVVVALVGVPIVFALLAGAGGDLGGIVGDGIATVAPTAALILFAVLFFSILLDAGLFDPLITVLRRFARDDPMRVVLATAVLTLLVAVDGDGSSTYIIVVSALLPVYRRLGMRVELLAVVAVMAAGTATLLPWGGPVIKAATALDVDVVEVYAPLVVPQLAGAAAVLGLAAVLGSRERSRLGAPRERVAVAPAAGTDPPSAAVQGDEPAEQDLRRPRLAVANLVLALAVMAPLIAGRVEPVLLFVAGTVVALLLNYPDPATQARLLRRHAPNAIPVTVLIFAAGVFTGVLSGTGMAESLATSLAALVPPDAGAAVPLATALLAFPLTFVVQQDTFYFGVLPVLSGAAAQFGVPAEAVARAAVVAQPLHAYSPTVAALFLLLGLLRLDYRAMVRLGVPCGLAVSAVVLAVALLTGAVPLP